MNPIFEHPVFDSAKEKMKHRKPLKTRCTLVSYVGTTICFLLQNRSGLLTREHLCSMSAEIVAINGETDYATNLS